MQEQISRFVVGVQGPAMLITGTSSVLPRRRSHAEEQPISIINDLHIWEKQGVLPDNPDLPAQFSNYVRA